MAAEQIVCPICGAKNPANVPRCQSCGAKIEVFKRDNLTEEEQEERKNQQEGFEWKWALAAFGIYLVLQAVILGLLPMVIPAFDPQGANGLLISVAVWFVGGILVGAISPGKTFIEPAVGAFLAVGPTIAWLAHISVVYQLSMLGYVVGGLIGVMVTLFGAFLGEKIQPSKARSA